MSRRKLPRWASGRFPTTLEALFAVACFVAASTLVGTGTVGAIAAHSRSDRTVPGPTYGVGPGFCGPWKGLSRDRLSVGGVYPCADPKAHDAWGASGAVDFVNRYEWAHWGLTAKVAAGGVVRDLRTVHKVPIGAMGHKQLPGCGDVISMFGGAGASPAGFAGVVVAVNVSATGTGTITYLDEDGTLYRGLSYGEDHLRVAAWSISTGWKGLAAYREFDWTLQTGGWRCASEIPGSARLNVGKSSQVNAVSCASPGNCSAGGSYSSSMGKTKAFIADEVAGTWQPAVELPGTSTLNVGENAGVSSVSCASPGNCAAGGWYSSPLGKTQAFIADEIAGAWQPAVELPGTSTLNVDGNAAVQSVSCTTPGNCAAGGEYEDSSGRTQVLVADEVAGTWQPAVEVPGTSTLNVGGNAAVQSVSCASPGSCAAGGWYSSSGTQAFVADEVAGIWMPAVEVPGSAKLNVGGNAGVSSVSCASPGNCAAGGWYSSLDGSQAFVADEVAGTWKPAVEVPGSAKLNAGGVSEILSVSCASPGNCAAGGDYEDSSGSNQAWVVDEVAGTWGHVIEVPGTAVFSAGGHTEGAALTAISSVSCASPGNCVAGGYEAYVAGREAIVAFETGGVWQRAIEVPGTSVLNAGKTAEIVSVSCASPGNCAAGGGYEDSSRNNQAFVADEVGGS